MFVEIGWNIAKRFLPTGGTLVCWGKRALTQELFGDEGTYFNTPSELICLVGTIASAFFSLLDFSLVHTGPSLLHISISGSCLVGLIASSRIRSLLYQNRALEKGIQERDEKVKKLRDDIIQTSENLKEISHLQRGQSELDEKYFGELRSAVTSLVERAQSVCGQGVASLARGLDSTHGVDGSSEAKDPIKKQLCQLSHSTLELTNKTNGDVQSALLNVSRVLFHAQLSKKNRLAHIGSAVQIIENDILPKVEGDTKAEYEKLSADLKALLGS